MTVRYRLLTRQEALDLVPAEYNPDGAEHGNLRLKATAHLRPDDVVAVVALEGQRIIGKMLLGYGWIPFNGTSIRLALAQDLLVSPQYRGQGIGAGLITESLNMQVPTIHSGLSAMAKPLFQRFAFPVIDQSPAYQLPITWRGDLRSLRIAADRRDRSDSALALLSRVASSNLSLRRRVLKNRENVKIIAPGQAVQVLPEVLAHREKPFQIPWNRQKLNKGLNGLDSHFRAWILEWSDGRSRSLHLVTAYRFDREVRLPFVAWSTPMNEWRVSEIYPPPQTARSACGILSATATALRGNGADVIEFFALDRSTVEACSSLGLNRSIEKYILLVPCGLSPELTTNITDASAWWCRALNENQFEESQEELMPWVAGETAPRLPPPSGTE